MRPPEERTSVKDFFPFRSVSSGVKLDVLSEHSKLSAALEAPRHNFISMNRNYYSRAATNEEEYDASINVVAGQCLKWQGRNKLQMGLIAG